MTRQVESLLVPAAQRLQPVSVYLALGDVVRVFIGSSEQNDLLLSAL